MRAFLVAVLCALSVAAHANADSTAPASFIPQSHVGGFLARNLDLASFRNSLGPRRTPTQRTFAALGITPTSTSGHSVVFEEDDWTYRIKILRRGDINGDGLEDLEICFTDKAKEGSYDTQQAMLATRYSASSLVTALHYEVDGCPAYAR